MKKELITIGFSFILASSAYAQECPSPSAISSAMDNLPLDKEIAKAVGKNQRKVIYSMFTLDYFQPMTLKEISEKDSVTCIYSGDDKLFYVLVIARDAQKN